MESAIKDWKESTRHLFFGEHKSIREIVPMVGRTRQSVSAYLRSLPEYEAERDRRRTCSLQSRKEYKRQKNRLYRAADCVTRETMQREHDIAALILSREKYH